MAIKNTSRINEVNTNGIQLLYSSDNLTITNVLYNSRVYTTSGMNSEALVDFIQSLKNGINCSEYQCKRIKSNVKTWLTTIGELNSVMAELDNNKKELAKQRILSTADNRRASSTEKLLKKVESGKLNTCHHVKVTAEDANINSIVEDIKLSLEYRTPCQIVKQHLQDMQYCLNNENELVKSDKVVFIGLPSILAWYYSNYDKATTGERLNKIDANPNNFDVAWDNLFKIDDNSYMSYGVLISVITTWLNFYNIDKKLSSEELNKIIRYMQTASIGL